MEKTKLEEFNPWWINGRVDPELALPYKREIYAEIEGNLKKRFVAALVGLRRVGKTTLLYQFIEKLLSEKISATSILFFSFDEASLSLSEVIESYREINAKDFRQEKTYIFLDEIQKCKNWENELKKYYDLYPKIKFVLSGSESLFIRKKTKETLAGRIFEFLLEPFSFREYLGFNGIKEEEFKYETRIKTLFLRYVQRGGFPETFSLERDKEFKEYIKSLVIDKIIYQDIPKIFRIEEPEFLLTLLELISTNPGMYIDYQSLSKQFGKDRRVVKDYLMYLKESFLIRLLRNYRKGRITTLRKKKRAYPSDTAIIYLYKSQQDETFFGKVAETSVANKIRAELFWKNRNEVDFVRDDIPVEVKYKERINSEDLKAVREFMKKFSVKEGVIITKKDEKTINVDEGRIRLIPLWKLLLE